MKKFKSVYALEGVRSDIPFSDIEEHWAKDIIMNNYNNEMVAEYPDGEFKPDNKLLRSELITLINRYFGLSKSSEDNFSDIDNSSDEWYIPETKKAKYYEYIDSLEAQPDEEATRKDVVLMLSSLLDIKGIDEESNFSDVDTLSSEHQA